MKNAIFALFLSLLLQSNISAGPLVYGAVSRIEGMAVHEIIDDQLVFRFTANNLRPEVVRDDWSRRMLSIKPLILLDNSLIYYLPRGVSGAEPGIYKVDENPHGNFGILLKAFNPDIVQITCNSSINKIVCLTEKGGISAMDLEGVSFTSKVLWESTHGGLKPQSLAINAKNRRVAVLVMDRSKIFELSIDNGEVVRSFSLNKNLREGLQRIFFLGGKGECFVEKNGDLGLINLLDSTYRKFVEGPMTCGVGDATGELYFMVARDNDERILYKRNLKNGRIAKVGAGYFDDFIGL